MVSVHQGTQISDFKEDLLFIKYFTYNIQQVIWWNLYIHVTVTILLMKIVRLQDFKTHIQGKLGEGAKT